MLNQWIQMRALLVLFILVCHSSFGFSEEMISDDFEEADLNWSQYIAKYASSTQFEASKKQREDLSRVNFTRI